ncbi:MAG: EAL domain-containing protein [Proteobacteria bacterium]|nr:EAL domain-containing protein [Pseudomonadota bacterium]
MHRLFNRQLASATLPSGEVDLTELARLVEAAYADAEHNQQRTERSIVAMVDELNQAQRRLLDALDVIAEGIAIFDADDRYLMWNRQYAEMYAPIEFAVGMRFEDALRSGLACGQYMEARGREEQWLAERLAAHRQASYTAEHLLDGGRWVRVEERQTVGGGSIGVRIDITDIKQREESLRILFEANPVPMWVIDPESQKFLAVNDAAIKHYGYSREQFMAMTQFDVRPPADRAAYTAFVKGGSVNYDGRVWTHQTADGRAIQVAVYARWLTYRGGKARLNALIDVTERQKAEHQLREQKMLMDAAIGNMAQGLAMFDADGRLLLQNDRHLEIYGMSPDIIKPGCTLRGLLEHLKQLHMFDGDAQIYADKMLAAIARGKTIRGVNELPDGRSIHTVIRPRAGGGWVATHEDVTERRQALRRIEYLAQHDALTGLHNRSYFNEQLLRILDEAHDDGRSFAVLAIDLDRFKEINDVFGHAAGDALLKELAARLQQVAGSSFVARLGGDEFSIIVIEGEQPAAAEDLANRLMTAAAVEFDANGHRVRSGLSIGVALYPRDGADATALLANADAGLYRAKREGRGSVRFFAADIDDQLRAQRLLQQDLQGAIDRNELRVYYQPQAKVDGTIVGFEALVRWQHPQRGTVSPKDFIPAAEECGLIIQIGEWVLREACREAASWPRPMKVAVNLSPVQFQHGDLCAMVHTVLLETGLAPRRLELEITEGVLVTDLVRAVNLLRRLKNLDVRIAMDDFGTGYSSLSYLQAFPFDKIKIDQSFVKDLGRGPQSAAIIRAVIGLARGLGLPVTAEGVETSAQLAFLAAESCDEIQGYLIGRPQPIEHYAALVGKAAEPRKRRGNG